VADDPNTIEDRKALRPRPALSKAEREERERLAAAIERMVKGNRLRWPVDKAERVPQALAEALLGGVHVDRSWVFTKKYSLPEFRIDEQSPEEWIRETDEKYRKFRDDELRKCLVATSVDFPVAKLTKRRGPGKKGRNVSIAERYEWAALRWLKYDWDTIARAYFHSELEQELAAAVSKVTKAGNDILRSAGLL
jgi:hypothetical protein